MIELIPNIYLWLYALSGIFRMVAKDIYQNIEYVPVYQETVCVVRKSLDASSCNTCSSWILEQIRVPMNPQDI